MIDQNKIQEIIENFNDNTLSLYLRVDPADIENQAQTPAWNIWLKNALSELESELDDSQKPTWENIISRVDNHFNVYQPNGRTFVLFMDADHEFIQELPFTMRNRKHFGKPHVAPLLWAMDEYEQYLIVMVDKQKAIFRKAYLGNLQTESEMTIDLEYDWGEKTLMPASGGDGQALRQGNNREAFEDMIEAHQDRFYGSVADEIKKLLGGDQPMRLILGGNERAANVVESKLHSSVSDQLVSVMSIPMDANDKEIMDRIWQTAYNYERNNEFDLVEEITSMAHANGRGVLGRDDLETAMERQQVEQIIMPYNLLHDDPDYAQKLTLWSLEHNRSMEFVHGQAAAKIEQAGGIAARLFYSLETA